MYNHSVYGKNADHIFWFSMHNTSLGKNAEPTRGSAGLSVPQSARCRPVSGNVTDKLLCSACDQRRQPAPAMRPRGGSPHPEPWGLPTRKPPRDRRGIGRCRPWACGLSSGETTTAFICQNEISAQKGGRRESTSSRWLKPQAFLCDSGRASVLWGKGTHGLAFSQCEVQIQDGKDELQMLKITFGPLKEGQAPGTRSGLDFRP